MDWRVRVGIVAVLALQSLAGCQRDVGECTNASTTDSTGPGAVDVYFDVYTGVPMYGGQALMYTSCGSGLFCHSEAAGGSDRYGVPHGLNYDVSLACISSSECGDVDCEGADAGSRVCEAFASNFRNSQRLYADRGAIMSTVRGGTMPPGRVGAVVRGTQSWVRRTVPSDPNSTVNLPDLDTSAGREILRNWLACSAPVISRSQVPEFGTQQLQSCSAPGEPVCVFNGAVPIPTPEWKSIYDTLILPRCVTCHGPSNPNSEIPGGASATGLAVLDLSGTDPNNTDGWASNVHVRVVNAATSVDNAAECGGAGTLVIPNNPDTSLMFQKLLGTQTCGEVMPPTASGDSAINPAVTDAVRTWITNGAANN